MLWLLTTQDPRRGVLGRVAATAWSPLGWATAIRSASGRRWCSSRRVLTLGPWRTPLGTWTICSHSGTSAGMPNVDPPLVVPVVPAGWRWRDHEDTCAWCRSRPWSESGHQRGLFPSFRGEGASLFPGFNRVETFRPGYCYAHPFRSRPLDPWSPVPRVSKSLNRAQLLPTGFFACLLLSRTDLALPLGPYPGLLAPAIRLECLPASAHPCYHNLSHDAHAVVGFA